MKKVTLLGDSIRYIGYGLKVPELLKDEFEVYQPNENCRFALFAQIKRSTVGPGASHIASATDLAESVCVGRAAVKAASEGVTRQMMTIVRDSTEPYAYHVEHSDVSKIANQIKAVPAEFINERGNNVTDECARYLLPLIAGEATPKYSNGIPEYLIIE